ncbi:sarcosine oxidase subunit gamma [Agrobacterium vitis]|uniref:Sarcosine oxidase subunit gamma n=2 Tax=Agrobacterium vitis TaxID=373 RepID=A0ABD6G857_AGRVI|nr:sarcosine oxidase subunit gamma [Agrobacterium vitis]MUO95332.1 sarcosine oxidase subunit gamma [Agrobacterium vitis]MUP04907.1 sarcosine oxidase subunit gamma [Agrobacterium vitis]MUZ83786.1 sarcosine oxidase subunit gamma [Agrobacterium vitis]MVA09385.1 sarcosine oxidase subunit gamma [Agrobacterium vitis]
MRSSMPENALPDSVLTDFHLVRRPALATKAVERFGVLTLETMFDATILHVLGKPGDVAPIPPQGFDLRNAGPGQWFAVGPASADQATAAFGQTVFLVDQSHGRVLIRISGAPVRHVLAKGTALDLHPDYFAIGAATTTLIGHIAVNLCRTGEDQFELLVMRGFAESLWDDLAGMAREFQ